MTIEQTAQASALFGHKQAKVNAFQSSEKKEEFAALLKEKSAANDKNLRARQRVLEAAGHQAKPNEAKAISYNSRAEELSYTPPKTPGYQKTLDEMIALANQSANSTTDAKRAQLNEDFKALGEKLYKQLSETDHYAKPVMPLLKQQIDALKIDNQNHAGMSFNILTNMNTYIDSIDGVAATEQAGTKLDSSLNELIDLANQAANAHPGRRAELAQGFEEKLNNFMANLESSGELNEAHMRIFKDGFEDMNLNSRGQASLAFNQLTNLSQYMSSLKA